MARDGEHKPSIENGVYKRTSVSQIRSFKGCEVAWGFDKIEKHPRRVTKGQATGIKGHEEVEILLKEGADVRGPIARSGSAMLEPYAHSFPARGGFGLVEWPLVAPTLRTIGGVEFVGFVDLSLLSGDVARIIDHKFKKKIALPPEGYGTAEVELADDEQAITYGYWGIEHYRVDQALFELHQYQTQGKKAFQPVSRLFGRAELTEKFQALCDFVDKHIAPAAKATRARDLKPNPKHCNKYGPCQYEKACPYSPRNRFIASIDPTWQPPPFKKVEKDMGLLDIVNPGAGASAPASTPAASKPATTKTLPALACVPETVYMLNDGKPASFKVAMNDVYYFLREGKTLQLQATDMVAEFLPETPAAAAAAPALATGVLPPDAPKSEPGGKLKVDDSSLPTAAQIAAANTPAASALTPKQEAAGLGTAPATSAETPETPADAEKKKRGRPPGSTNSGLVLLIDCAASFETTDLNPVIASWLKKIAEKAGLPDVRFAPKKDADGNDHPLAFGGWKGVLSLSVLNNLPKGFCSITSSDLNAPAIEALCGVADKVIRGAL